jgi:hypothetical protein
MMNSGALFLMHLHSVSTSLQSRRVFEGVSFSGQHKNSKKKQAFPIPRALSGNMKKMLLVAALSGLVDLTTGSSLPAVIRAEVGALTQLAKMRDNSTHNMTNYLAGMNSDLAASLGEVPLEQLNTGKTLSAAQVRKTLLSYWSSIETLNLTYPLYPITNLNVVAHSVSDLTKTLSDPTILAVAKAIRTQINETDKRYTLKGQTHPDEKIYPEQGVQGLKMIIHAFMKQASPVTLNRYPHLDLAIASTLGELTCEGKKEQSRDRAFNFFSKPLDLLKNPYLKEEFFGFLNKHAFPPTYCAKATPPKP